MHLDLIRPISTEVLIGLLFVWGLLQVVPQMQVSACMMVLLWARLKRSSQQALSIVTHISTTLRPAIDIGRPSLSTLCLLSRQIRAVLIALVAPSFSTKYHHVPRQARPWKYMVHTHFFTEYTCRTMRSGNIVSAHQARRGKYMVCSRLSHERSPTGWTVRKRIVSSAVLTDSRSLLPCYLLQPFTGHWAMQTCG